ncbi:hypothetical protein AU189_15605 [Mycolicibacterium acapulense]|nr:hypothetical protein AU189_15605 [Mycolicibacterium acapulense]
MFAAIKATLCDRLSATVFAGAGAIGPAAMTPAPTSATPVVTYFLALAFIKPLPLFARLLRVATYACVDTDGKLP